MYKVDLKESFFPAIGGNAPAPLTISQTIENSVSKWGSQKALRELLDDGSINREWTYQELYDQSQKLANALATRHAQGARIAVYANNIPEWVITELACGFAGIVLVTVNPSFQRNELKYVLEQSGAEAIYFIENFRGNPMGDIVRAACSGITAIKHKIDLKDDAAMYAGSENPHGRTCNPDDTVQIQYTSGTTGFPKGALLHANGLIRNGIDSQTRSGVLPGDSVVHFLPLFHTTGCAMMVLGGLSCGVTINLSPIFDPQMLVDVIAREKPRYLGGVPTMLVALMQVANAKGTDLSFIERVGSGGSMVAPELCKQAKEVFGVYIQIMYGQTETSPVITQTWHDDSLEDLTQTTGQPLPYMDVAILDPGNNTITPIGVQGEICARGYNVMHGYNDNPEATAATIDKDGWLHTGDLGTMDSRGYVKITGRVKEMIIRGGENLFPVEIENVILQHPDVAEAAVVGVPDPKWGEEVACFMRSSTGKKPGNSDLKSFMRDRLSPQKTPTHWVWVDDWPLTGSGKIQKFKLREQFEAEN
ncbi:MAG: AMP-binding protein [Hellea sp.]|nr:AMP-binding protein [Hellea sp.]